MDNTILHNNYRIITGNFHNDLQYWTEFVRNTQECVALEGITNKFSPILKVIMKIASYYTIYSTTYDYPR